METLIDWTERGWIPDRMLRLGIRRLLKQRLRKTDQGSDAANRKRLESLVAEFSAGPLALVPEKANEQHYDVPARLFELTLGPRLKYSCCYWPDGINTLALAEELALETTCQRAELQDGMRILELGCGWGSLTLWMAARYPNARITAVSNSSSQKSWIEQQARIRGIGGNLTVVTQDINELELSERFDRVVSVEMLEHVRNHRLLFHRISDWLTGNGKLFVHIFCHRDWTYKFQDEGSSDWMSRHFFSGGMMPGRDLLAQYQDDLKLERQWDWNGKHYQLTCEAWLNNMADHREEILELLSATYGPQDATRWFHRWRMFYLACSELFGFDNGNQWLVAHYLFANRNR